jgi:hypothetical protein
MRLYPRREGTAAVDHAGVHYEAAKDGGFDFPNEVSGHLHSFCVRGEPLWEDSIERQHRLIAEEAARRADPSTLLAAVEKLVAQAEAGEAAKPAARKTRAAAAA